MSTAVSQPDHEDISPRRFPPLHRRRTWRKESHIMQKLLVLVAAAILAALPSIEVLAGHTVP
jgi:hypothetical protein